jgi:hypothetical protein
MTGLPFHDSRSKPALRRARAAYPVRSRSKVFASLLASIAFAAGWACAGPNDADGLGNDTLDLPEEALQAMQSALADYEALRSLLVEDASNDDVRAAATRLAADLAAAKAAWPVAAGDGRSELAAEIESAAAAADMLTAADGLLDSRRAFGEVTRHLLPAAAADARLRRDRHVFQCTMTETFALWMQADDEIANPYLGAAMPTCGERVGWAEASADAGGTS